MLMLTVIPISYTYSNSTSSVSEFQYALYDTMAHTVNFLLGEFLPTPRSWKTSTSVTLPAEQFRFLLLVKNVDQFT